MVERYYQIFTHLDVLKSREPEYFICEKPIVVEFDDLIDNKKREKRKETGKVKMSEMIDNNNEKKTETQVSERFSTLSSTSSAATVKSFVSILEEGCKKYYDGTPPIFTRHFAETPNSFAILCELYGIHTMGSGRTKKIAKQMAAKEMLKKMIEKDSFSDFGLGKTKDEAFASLESLAADFQNRGSGDDFVTENWVGKVNERCQKLKILNAVYEIDEDGPPNQRIFIATCKIAKVQTVAHGKTKKIAKTLAAQKMYAQLENWKDLAGDDEYAAFAATGASGDGGGGGSEKALGVSESAMKENGNALGASTETVLDPESLQKVRAALDNDSNAKSLVQKLTELISSGDENINKVFLNQELKFIFLQPDFDGNVQCMLSVNGPNDVKNAFYGYGAAEADAKNFAARNALVHLELFVRTSELGRNSTEHPDIQTSPNSNVKKGP